MKTSSQKIQEFQKIQILMIAFKFMTQILKQAEATPLRKHFIFSKDKTRPTQKNFSRIAKKSSASTPSLIELLKQKD